jgi:cysteine desulfurase
LAPGGGQERGRRGGTVDVAAAVGLATALRLVSNEREETRKHVLALRQRLEQGLTALEGCALTAPTAQRVPGTVHVTFEGLASDELIFLLDQAGICASAASACSSGAMVASHVLGAMGMSPARANGSVRFSMGAENSTKEVDRVIASTQEIVGRLRASR